MRAIADRLAKASLPAPAPAPAGHVHTHLAVPLLRTTTPAAFESSAKLPVVMAKIATLAAEARITAWTPAHARSVEDRLAAILAWTSGAAAAPPAGPVAPVANLIGPSVVETRTDPPQFLTLVMGLWGHTRGADKRAPH